MLGFPTMYLETCSRHVSRMIEPKRIATTLRSHLAVGSKTSPRTRPFGSSKMPKGPKGQNRPADVIGNAVCVMEIATGQREEETAPEQPKNEAAAELGRKGGKARAEKLSESRRSEIAKKAAELR